MNNQNILTSVILLGGFVLLSTVIMKNTAIESGPSRVEVQTNEEIEEAVIPSIRTITTDTNTTTTITKGAPSTQESDILELISYTLISNPGSLNVLERYIADPLSIPQEMIEALELARELGPVQRRNVPLRPNSGHERRPRPVRVE